MIPDIRFRDEPWRVALARDANCMRRLWASVALLAVVDAATNVARCRAGGKHDVADMEIEAFRRWVEGRDGREVLTNAGVIHDGRVVSSLVDRVRRGDANAGRAFANRQPSTMQGAGAEE